VKFVLESTSNKTMFHISNNTRQIPEDEISVCSLHSYRRTERLTWVSRVTFNHRPETVIKRKRLSFIQQISNIQVKKFSTILI